MSKDLLILLTKHPQPGKVKTRLAEDIGENNALKVYTEMLRIQIDYHQNQSYDFLLDVTPSKKLQEIGEAFSIEHICIAQMMPSYGQEINYLFEHYSKHYEKVLVGVCDAPHLNTRTVHNALEALNTNDFVVGPTLDGGFYLLGLREYQNFFADIPWGTHQSREEILKNVRNAHSMVSTLGLLQDIDKHEDISYFPELFPFVEKKVS